MIRAERALHDRASWACEAALAAGVPGGFRAWEQDGVLAVLATDPALGFLSSVSRVTPETVSAAIDLATAPVWGDTNPAVVVPEGVELPPAAGFVRAGTRLLAVARLDVQAGSDPEVVDADDGFADVLLAGYEVTGAVAAFIRAEHQLPAVQRFLVVEQGTSIAAAAMTIHGDVAVLGGASTLRAHRGKGAQSRLLRHRLRVAAEAGCALAVATAATDSVSAANLGKAGFALHRRTAWVKRG